MAYEPIEDWRVPDAPPEPIEDWRNPIKGEYEVPDTTPRGFSGTNLAGSYAPNPIQSAAASSPGSGGQYNLSSGYAQGYYADPADKGETGSPPIASYGSTKSPNTTRSHIKYTGDAPEVPTLKDYESPDEPTAEERAASVRVASSLGLRESKRNLREVLAGLDNSPAGQNARAKALGEHGINVARAIEGGTRKAEADEARDMAIKTQEAITNYNAYLNNRTALINNAWKQYTSTGVQITSHSYVSDDTESNTRTIGGNFN